MSGGWRKLRAAVQNANIAPALGLYYLPTRAKR